MVREAGEAAGARARYACRLRVSATARAGLEAEWARCRWVWNECVARSTKAHAQKEACGAGLLDRMLTRARAVTPWLAAGSSVPQQQTVRDFAASRAKALKDIKGRLPVNRRAGMPRHRRRHRARPTLNCARRGFRLKDGSLRLAGGIVLGVVWAKKVVCGHDVIAVEDFRPRFLARSSMARRAADAAIDATQRALIEMGRKHGRDIRLVHPAHTTMDCGRCGAGTKHALPLSERTYTRTACGAVSPRDKNSARVMLLRAGLDPAGVEGARPPGALLREAA
ncbi:zinc ribbon domain-containing protein [Streptomyces sp. NPDC003393]